MALLTNASRRRLHTLVPWRTVLAGVAAPVVCALVCSAAAAPGGLGPQPNRRASRGEALDRVAQQSPGSQASKPAANPRAFLGTWVASFQGKPFLTLRFARKAGKLAGTLSKGQITFHPDGEIASVSVTPGADIVTIEKVEPGALYFRRNTTSSLRFALQLRDLTHADLDFLDVPPDSIQPKPIPLVKQANHP